MQLKIAAIRIVPTTEPRISTRMKIRSSRSISAILAFVLRTRLLVARMWFKYNALADEKAPVFLTGLAK